MPKLNFPDPQRGIRMPYGKHKGEFLSEVPTHYLEWAIENLTSYELLNHIEEELYRRRSGRPGAGKIIKK